MRALLLLEPDFGAATVLFATGFGLLFLAGARLRYVIAHDRHRRGVGFAAPRGELQLPHAAPDCVPGSLGGSVQQRLSADAVADRDRPRRMVRRRAWATSVQKLFYLPEAHTDFLFAVLAEELGLVGVVLTLALFLALVWRSFHIARLAADAGLKFPAYLAAGFGLWVGIAGVHQHRRQHGGAADQGADAAAHELRRARA